MFIMKAPQIPQNQSSKTTTSPRKLISITIALVIVAFIAFGALVAIDAVRTNHQKDLKAQQDLIVDKATFAQAESDMDKAYAEIVATIGKPAVEDKSKTCARSEQKFGYGNMNCGIAYTFAYPESSIKSSVLNAQKLKELIKDAPYFLGLESDFFPSFDDSTSQTVNSHLYIKSRYPLICHIDYQYDSPESYRAYEIDKIESERISYYQFSCSKDVGLAVYTQAK